jgi:hypothetical protein
MEETMKRFIEWIEDVFLYTDFGIVSLLVISMLLNFYQYSFMKGYQENVGIITTAFEQEQLENFDLNRAVHERNLQILDLNFKYNECVSMLQIIEEETDGSIAVKHILEDD